MLGKVPSPKGKIQRRWIKGVWLGKLDRDDSNVGRASSAIAVRSIRRLPKEGQISSAWQPRDGVRHKITRELSQPTAFPAPAVSGSPERGEAEGASDAGSGRTQRRLRRPRGASRGTAGTDAGCGGISRSSGWSCRRQSRSNNASGIPDCRSSAVRARASGSSERHGGKERGLIREN